MGRISKLHEYTLDKVNSKFPYLKARENYYPDWLLSPVGTRLELDIYIDDLKIAAEIQGSQHSFFVPFFHGTVEEFEKQKAYDEHKKYICKLEGVKLYDIATEQDADIMVYEIKDILQSMETNKPKYYYQDNGIDGRITKEKWHETELRKMLGLTRKQLKKTNVNSDERMARRLEACKNNFSLYQSGELQADEEKIKFWIRIIENNGYEIEPHDDNKTGDAA